ncbi:MAG: hypothetical protein ACREIS_14815 [Nitrospiraceae bacterium]
MEESQPIEDAKTSIDIGDLESVAEALGSGQHEGAVLGPVPAAILRQMVGALIQGYREAGTTEPYREPEDQTSPEWIGPEVMVNALAPAQRLALRELKLVHIATAADLAAFFSSISTVGPFVHGDAVELTRTYFEQMLMNQRERHYQNPLAVVFGGGHRHGPPEPPKH